MREQRRPNYYTLLGLSPQATPEEVKRRYRKLVRRYHPDVRPDKEVAHQQFVQIVEAYQTLSDPDRRRAYDAALGYLAARDRGTTGMENGKWKMENGKPESGIRSNFQSPISNLQGQRAGGREKVDPQQAARQSQVEALLSMAERYLARREYASAIEQCKKIVRLDPQHAAAHALWGDAYFEQGEFDRAILMYSFAVQFDPRSVLYAEKLQQAVRSEQMAEARERTRAARQSAPESRERTPCRSTPPSPPHAGGDQRGGTRYRSTHLPFLPYISAALGLWAIGLVVWAMVRPGPAISERVSIPLHVAISAVGVGGLIGMLLALNRWIGPFDEELVYATVQEKGIGGVPVGIYLCIASLIWIYFGLVFYFVVALLNEDLSKSVLKAFGVTFLIVGLSALLASEAWKPILLFGGNFVFTALVLGWLMGNVGQKPW